MPVALAVREIVGVLDTVWVSDGDVDELWVAAPLRVPVVLAVWESVGDLDTVWVRDGDVDEL